MLQQNGLRVTTRTKVVAMLAAATVCALSAFPARLSSHPGFTEVPRAFLFGNVNVATVVVLEGRVGSDPLTTRIACSIDLARLATESVVVLSAATMIALLLHMRSCNISADEEAATTESNA